jgi:hypothetical protein
MIRQFVWLHIAVDFQNNNFAPDQRAAFFSGTAV